MTDTPEKIIEHIRAGVTVLATYYLACLSPEEREAMRGRTFSVSTQGDPFRVALIDDLDRLLMVLPAEGERDGTCH